MRCLLPVLAILCLVFSPILARADNRDTTTADLRVSWTKSGGLKCNDKPPRVAGSIATVRLVCTLHETQQPRRIKVEFTVESLTDFGTTYHVCGKGTIGHDRRGHIALQCSVPLYPASP